MTWQGGKVRIRVHVKSRLALMSQVSTFRSHQQRFCVCCCRGLFFIVRERKVRHRRRSDTVVASTIASGPLHNRLAAVAKVSSLQFDAPSAQKNWDVGQACPGVTGVRRVGLQLCDVRLGRRHFLHCSRVLCNGAWHCLLCNRVLSGGTYFLHRTNEMIARLSGSQEALLRAVKKHVVKGTSEGNGGLGFLLESVCVRRKGAWSRE